jgi:putative endonuclease
MEDKPCFVYIIECNNGAYYTGITNDVLRRWNEHRTGKGALYVKMFGFKKPIFLKQFDNKSLARRFEISIKKVNKKQKSLIISVMHACSNSNELLNEYIEKFNKKIYK